LAVEQELRELWQNLAQAVLDQQMETIFLFKKLLPKSSGD
jgi:hypothetical protein